jgi:hypothetical protein
MPRLSDAPPSRAIPIGPWTHESLREPVGWAYPLKGAAPAFGPLGSADAEAEYLTRWGDRSKPHTVQLSYFSPGHGEGWTSLSLTKTNVARWLHGISGSFCFMDSGDPPRRREREVQAAEAEEVYAKLAEFDWSGLEFQLRPTAGTAADRRRRTARRLGLKEELGEVMSDVLRAAEGEPVPDSQVYAAFVSRRIEVHGLRVCESCQVVFPTRVKGPARLCRICRRPPPRYRFYAFADGGWHVNARLGPPAHHFLHGHPGQPRKAIYLAICSECERRFESSHANRRLCRNCGGRSGRVRRSRGGSPLGRQLFRFVGEGDHVSVGIRHGDGSQGTVATNEFGVIETVDAEIAAQLEANTELRKID